MRKGITPIVGIVLALIIFLIGGAMLNVAGGKAGDTINYMKGALGGCGLGCSKCISEPVSYDEFMATIAKVHNDCEADDKTCGKTTCGTVDFSPDTCYNVNRKSLDSYGLWYFSNLPVCVWLSSKFNLVCNAEDSSSSGGWIQYYGKSENCKVSSVFGCIGDRGDYFSIGNGASFKVSAKIRGIILTATDVKLKVSGGDYASCIDAPKKPDCTTDAECATSNSHGYCNDKGACSYARYCEHVCDESSNGPLCTTDKNNPSSKKCVTFTVNCNADGTCPQTTVKCSNTLYSTVTRIGDRFGRPVVIFDTTPANQKMLVSNSAVAKDEEAYFSDDGIGGLSMHYFANRNDIKMSMHLDELTADNKATMYLGCY